ncbi:MAG: YkuS family protein [Veillonellales bacterium]
MSKIIALQSYSQNLATFLFQQGYTVIDLQTAHFPGKKVDAILLSGYHPDMVTSHTSLTETAHITLGNISHDIQNHPAAITLNITGLTPEQILAVLQYRLRRRN